MSSKAKTKKPGFLSTLKKHGPLRLGCLAGMAYIAALNIEPYTRLIAPIIKQPALNLVGGLAQVPFVSGAVGTLTMVVAAGASVVPWGLVQGFQVAPTLLESSRENLKQTIEGLRRNSHELQSDPDSPAKLQELIDKYNKLPVATLLGFYAGKALAYTVDALVVTLVYPPFKEGWGVLQYGVPMLSDWDIENLAKTFCILFVFEALLNIYLWSQNVAKYLIQKETTPA